MKVTFLGHQGWAFESAGVTLVDPLFEAMGNGKARLPVWPPRRLDLEGLSPITGLVLTHEHSDHFDLDTLWRLPYRGDVWIPSLSSSAMRIALTDMGYSVRQMEAFQAFVTGTGLTFVPLSLQSSTMERDVYGLLVRDAGGHSFLTTVDGVPHESLGHWLAQQCPARSIDNFTNNYIQQLEPLSDLPYNPELALGEMTKGLIEFVEHFRPSRVIISGLGWHHTGRHEYLNHKFFTVTNDRLQQVGQLVFPHIDWIAARPGQQFDPGQAGLEPVGVRGVHPLAPKDRGVRVATPTGTTPWVDLEPLSGADLARVDEFIQSSYGTILGAHAPELMAALYELKMQPELPFSPTLLIRLRNGEKAFDYALDHGSLQFMPVVVDGNPARRHAMGFELWALDLLTLLNSDEEAFLIYESSVRHWNNAPGLVSAPILIEAFGWFAPRFRQRETLGAYRRRLSQIAAERSKDSR